MKIVFLIARLLLGLVFTVFGLNGFLHFIPMPLPTGDAGEFFGILFRSDYYMAIFALQFVGGVLLLVGQFVPVALVMLGPILVNILLYHTLLMQGGFPIPIFVTVLWFLVFWGHRGAFRPIFQR
jgi:uncharacterized membrane protein YphA (DoxX/SURF4 family)